MRYAWSGLRAEIILDYVQEVAETDNPGWLQIRLAGQALSESSIDSELARDAFERLVQRHEAAREAYVHWRDQITR